MGRCQICGKISPLVSDDLGVCLDCIRRHPTESLMIAERIHKRSREIFGLPVKVPRKTSGILCGMCSNDCRIGSGSKGFCGLVANEHGRLVRLGGSPEKGILDWYYDPLPTNCVAEWFCPGCTGAGYPKYARSPTAEIGYLNLAVFYGSCSYNCIYCQNWHYHSLASKLKPAISSRDLASKVADNVTCICYFGGDPSVQMPHALDTCHLALDRVKERGHILRFCWETNGYWKKEFAVKAAEYSLASGGIIKVDLKSWDHNVSIALCGVSNIPSLESFKMIGSRFYSKRPEVPIVTASTLLVPGYVDKEEIGELSKFIASINPKIPYTLLAFYPQFMLTDLPTTSRKLAFDCLDVAMKNLENVRIGNMQLLS
ncbi:MAG: radical SAM protein [Nitrososphaeria archaeon]